MKPPIKVTVTTDNMNRCELRLAGEDGVAQAIQVPSAGNVYMGLHSIREPLQDLINGILEAHGIVPEAVEPEPVTQPGPPASAEHPVLTTPELPPPAPEPPSYVAIGSAETWDGREETAENPFGDPALAVAVNDEEPPAAS